MICNNCGATFDAADIMYYTEDYGERFAACPCCGDHDISDAVECAVCGGEFTSEELYNGVCLDCLWNSINYKTALDFLDDSHQLVEFMINVWFQSNVTVHHATNDLRDFLRSVFENIAATETYSQSKDLLNRCRDFILPKYPNSIGMDGLDYAEWYEEYRQEHSDD